MLKMKMALMLTMAFIPLNLGFAKAKSAKSKDVPAGERGITEKESAELNKYKKRDALITALTQIPGAPNRFDKETLYVMKNFNILQKIKGGYLITAESVVWSSGNSMDFGVAFLKTSKNLPEDVLITGAVVYDGEFKYTAVNGFEKKIPRVKIPANLPISGIRKSGDPFTPEYF